MPQYFFYVLGFFRMERTSPYTLFVCAGLVGRNDS
jgi:hypothetical protein